MQTRHLGTLTPALGLLATLVLHAATTRSATPSAAPMAAGLATTAPVAARNRLIVKYRDSVTVCMHCWYAHRGVLTRRTADSGASLDALDARYGIVAATPIFRTEEDERRLGSAPLALATLRRFEHQRLLAARAAYPRRALRAGSRRSPSALYHVYVLQLAVAADPERAAADFRRDPHVEYAHPDYVVHSDYLPDDPYFTSSGAWHQAFPDLWALRPDKLAMEAAWNLSRGQGVVVGVVDSGADYRHADLAANVWSNPGEIPGNHLDDDHNGFVDDVRGWSFVTCKEYDVDHCKMPSTPGNDPLDDNGHGTHVAGTIAAVGNNGRGIVGVAPEARIMPVKAFNSQGVGLTSETATALLYAGMNGAAVINNSWGCGFCPSVPLHEDVLRTLDALGVVTVWAAGNSASDVRYRSPQNLHDPKPIVVAASNEDDEPTWFSSFGPAVDVAAPGGGRNANDANVLSLRASSCALCTGAGRKLIVDRGYLRLQGTSMATPHVSGLAALLLAQRPDLTTDEVRQLIRSSADDIGADGYDLRTGAGRIDAANALASEPPLTVRIDAPGNLTLASGGSVTVSGTAAGPELESRQLLYRDEQGGSWISITAPEAGEVRGAELGSWNLAGLPWGWKHLRLRATDRRGRTFDDVISVGTQLAERKVRGGSGRSLSPDLAGDLAVWIGDVREARDRHGVVLGSEGRLYLHDFTAGKTRRLSEQYFRNSVPRVDGNVVAWYESGGPPRGGTLYACVYERAAESCPIQRAVSNVSIGWLAVSGQRLVFSGATTARHPPSVRPFLGVHDLASHTTRELAVSYGVPQVGVDGDLVVWERIVPPARPGPYALWNSEIVVYDLATGVERTLTHTPEMESDPQIDGHRVIYERRHQPAADLSATTDLVLFDLDTGAERVLVTGFPRGGLFGRASQLSADRVVWTSVDELWMYDLVRGEKQAVVVSPIVPRNGAAISGNRLTWLEITDFSLLTGDIHNAELPH